MAPAPDENSTFSRLMNTRVAQVNRGPNLRVAAVVIFEKGVTIAEAENSLRNLDLMIESADVQEFNPEYGSPVFYVP